MERGAHSAKCTIQAQSILDHLCVGDSVAVNGICLTVVKINPASFVVDIMHETLNRTQLKAHQRVNLERALALGDRLDGHLVSGHIDGTGKIVHIKRDDNAVWFRIQCAPSILRLIVEKGSIAIDGISLTVARVQGGDFSVSIIPHTLSHTALGSKQIGELVHLETDLIGKYVARLIEKPSKLEADWLMELGF